MLDGILVNPRRKFEASDKGRWVLEEKRLPYGIKNARAYAIGNKVYCFGGQRGLENLPTDQILHSTLDANGILSDWKVHDIKLPYDVTNAGLVVQGDWVHLIGGWSESPAFRGHRDTVISCKFNASGEMTGWITQKSKLPLGLGRFAVTLIDDVVWTFGGWDGWNVYSKSQFCKLNLDGTFGNWNVESVNLISANYNGSAVNFGGKVYCYVSNNLYVRDIITPLRLGPWTSRAIERGEQPINASHFTIANKHSIVAYHDMLNKMPSNGEIVTTFNTDGTLDNNNWKLFGSALPVPMEGGAVTLSDSKVLIIGGSTFDLDNPNTEQVYSSEPSTGFDRKVRYYTDLPETAPAYPIKVPPGEHISTCNTQLGPYPPWCFQTYDQSLKGTKYLVQEDSNNENRWSIYEIGSIGGGGRYRYNLIAQSVPTIPVNWSPEPSTGFDVVVDTYDKLPLYVEGKLNIPPGENENTCFFSPAPRWCYDYTYDTRIVGKRYLVRSSSEHENQWVIYRAGSLSGAIINWFTDSKAEKVLMGDIVTCGNYVVSARLLFNGGGEDGGDGGYKLPVYTQDSGGPGPFTFTEFDPEDNAGYFGEVNGSTFITTHNLRDLLGIKKGVVLENDPGWFKFYIDRHIVYYPKRSLISNISYQDLMDLNLISGERSVLIRGKMFKVTLMQGMSLGSLDSVKNSNHDSGNTLRSEWNRLMYRMVEDDPNYPMTSKTTTNWLRLPQGAVGVDLNTGKRILCKERNPRDRDNVITRGGTSVTEIDRVSLETHMSDYHWRPLLILKD